MRLPVGWLNWESEQAEMQAMSKYRLGMAVSVRRRTTRPMFLERLERACCSMLMVWRTTSAPADVAEGEAVATVASVQLEPRPSARWTSSSHNRWLSNLWLPTVRSGLRFRL